MPHQKLLHALKAHGLDSLYSQVLSNALYPDGTPVPMADLLRIMGILLLIQRPLPIKHQATIMNIPPRPLVESFLSIQSILLMPESDDDPVQLVHTSLRDFLMTPARSGAYFIDPPIRHISIAIGCLDIMTKNKTEFWFTDEPLRYACTEWLDHLRKALPAEEGHCPSDLSLSVSLKYSLTNFTNSSLGPWLHSMIIFTKLAKTESSCSPLELSRYPQSLQSTLTSLNNMLGQTIVRTVCHFTWYIMMKHLQPLAYHNRNQLERIYQQPDIWLTAVAPVTFSARRIEETEASLNRHPF
ncbi:hypothetical protein SERLADRAFT_459576 [Serpula lacrymans var. lacrymans S7.9]|uniref:Uncharacterized protein n=1 Tax=Serpula lacrymans var. lacrymans (strain S7.9) TaxID=578457 RepID=F8NKK6_SERL9|nr:uncharacterized protein SERLADRAFT_459576 [Serpula lacrymans var. lacrymans S7.9]EGO28778.1 hypothetical protein SERLADRAFT_459576 [Serpula lacrymans var. lacrymans S7.9]